MNPHSQNAENQKSKLEDRLLDSPPTPETVGSPPSPWAVPKQKPVLRNRLPALANDSWILFLPLLWSTSKPFGSFTAAKLGVTNCGADVGSFECEGSLSSLLLHGLFFLIRTPQIA